MPTSVLIAVALSVLLGILVIFLPLGHSDTPASTATDPVTINAETVGGRNHIDCPQVRWNVNRGSVAYLTMLDQLRDLADAAAAHGVGDGVDSGADVALTDDDTVPQSFADILISGGSHTPAVHAIVRLGDFAVVRFLPGDTPRGFVLNAAPGAPFEEDATDNDRLLGKADYDALARVANQPLTAINLSSVSLVNSLRDLGARATGRPARARGLLCYLIAVTEASRFRSVADRIANGMDNGGDVFVTAQQADQMRHGTGIGHVFIGRDRTDGL
ncbi:ribosome-inactivating family protein [Streptomyces sp. NPDC057438]|uniref:ribosome-inactivating family protein n=1 Tax=Streptomyces sp. NPDC057438 TaxID=3346133 RepID=UPI0036A5D69C